MISGWVAYDPAFYNDCMFTRFPLPLLMVCLLGGCSTSPPSGPILLGHLSSSPDEEEIHGIALAVDPINADAARHITGRKIRVIHADAGKSPDEALGQASRLLTLDKVEALLGPGAYSQVEKTILAAQSPPTLVLTLAGYAGNSPGAMAFPVGLDPAEQGRFLAQYIKESVKTDRVVILKENDAMVAGLAARALAGHLSPTKVVEHAIKAGETPDLFQNFDKEGSSTFVLCGSAKSILTWRSKLPKQHLFIAGEELELARLASDRDAERPLTAVVSFDSVDGSAAAQAFTKRFQEKYGKLPSLAAALAHDSANVWIEAARRANSIQYDKLREQLTKADATFPILTGNIRWMNQSPRRPGFVVRFEGPSTTLLKRYEP